MTDLSVIIVSWNARDYLAACLRSLGENGLGDRMEVIVVDNASSDGSPALVREQFPAALLVETGANLGFARGNNVGIGRAKGRWLALVNSDVELLPGCLRRMVDYLEANPRVGMLGPRVLNTDRTIQRSCRNFPSLGRLALRALGADNLFPSITYPDCRATRPVDVLSGCFWMARREAVEQVGGLDEGFFMYSEDVDWCRRFAAAGWGVVFLAEAEAVHHGGASSRNMPVRFYVEMYRAQHRYFGKHHGRAAQAAFSAIVFAHQLARVARGAAGWLIRPSRRAESSYRIRRSLACMAWLLGRTGEESA